VVSAERLVDYTPARRIDASPSGERWGGYRSDAIAGGIRISGLPAGLVRVELVAKGFRAAQSEAVRLFPGTGSDAQPVTLVPDAGPAADGRSP
jgi:hypothetical protein